ncbi:hypothetical protein DL96DRAFT_203112 [Flagelloscypha sp. PMI_526]|nr:hypothetical protein DL96DRAFT_203112 [Flagelloscypha sp. PMI_526]
MAWAALLSCRALPQYLTSRTLLAPLSVGTRRILYDPSCFARSRASARQMFSTSMAKLDAVAASTTITEVDASAMRSAIVQAIQELPIMTKDGVEEYAGKCFAESQELCQRDQTWSATIPWLKGFISGIAYPNSIQQHEKAACAQCTFPKLKMVYEFMHSILSQITRPDSASSTSDPDTSLL